jgi:hypothetical protein
MKKPAEFGRLLTEAVYRIAGRDSKSIQIVQDELGYALEGHAGGSAIEYWRKGNVPARNADIVGLARELMRRTDFDRAWLERLLTSAGYNEVVALCDQLRPIAHETTSGQLSSGDFAIDIAPFVVGPPITYCRQFFGRDDEVRRIFSALSRMPLQNVAIVGLQRSGKTSLLHYVRQVTTAPEWQMRNGQRSNWLKQPERYRWIFVDFQDARMRQLESLLRYLLDQLDIPVPEPCNLISFMNSISHNLRLPTVILMDEIGAAIESPELDMPFWWSLRSLGTNQSDGNLAFIVTSHQVPEQHAASYGKPSPFFNIFHRLDIGPLTEAAALELIYSSPRPITRDDARWIVEQSGCWPALVQILCQYHLDAEESGWSTQQWREQALRNLSPYRYLLGESQ